MADKIQTKTDDGAAKQELVPCPECGKMLNPHIGLATHRSRMHGVKRPHRRRLRKPGAKKLTPAAAVAKVDLLPAMHLLVNTAMGIAELAEGAIAAGELVVDAVRPLRKRYIALQARAAKVSDTAKRFQADLNEED